MKVDKYRENSQAYKMFHNIFYFHYKKFTLTLAASDLAIFHQYSTIPGSKAVL